MYLTAFCWSRKEHDGKKDTSNDGKCSAYNQCQSKYNDVFEAQGVEPEQRENAEGCYKKSMRIFPRKTAWIAVEFVVGRVVPRVGKCAGYQYVASEDEPIEDVKNANDVGIGEYFAIEYLDVELFARENQQRKHEVYDTPIFTHAAYLYKDRFATGKCQGK